MIAIAPRRRQIFGEARLRQDRMRGRFARAVRVADVSAVDEIAGEKTVDQRRGLESGACGDGPGNEVVRCPVLGITSILSNASWTPAARATS